MYQRIVVPVDGSETSMRGLTEAVKIARLTGGSLRLVYMVDELRFTVGMEGGAFYAGNVISLMRDAGAKLLQDAKLGVEGSGVKADTRILECAGSRLADVVNEQVKSWDADLIVIGSHGRRGASRFFLGSDAEQILRAARVPVLLVRAPESRAAVAEPRPKHS